MTNSFTGILKVLVDHGISGSATDVDFIMDHLHEGSSLAMTRFVDYALSLVSSSSGANRIRHYLFHGTLIQRNYASLYLNRLGHWPEVKLAYEMGLIDAVQAFAR